MDYVLIGIFAIIGIVTSIVLFKNLGCGINGNEYTLIHSEKSWSDLTVNEDNYGE